MLNVEVKALVQLCKHAKSGCWALFVLSLSHFLYQVVLLFLLQSHLCISLPPATLLVYFLFLSFFIVDFFFYSLVTMLYPPYQ